MRIIMACLGLPLLMLGSGCAPMPTVALEATPADLEVLAGNWTGEYTSAALGRRGSIEFNLKAGTDEARGDVVMVPQGNRRPYERESRGQYREQPYQEPGMARSVLLTIRFIRASNGSVTGMLDRYWDPDRNCLAQTMFRGYMGIGTVEGTFTTTFDCGAGEATGTWKVTRKMKTHAAGS
jgi:hypothetical protein